MTSTSSISVQKYVDHRSKSCDTVCSSNSSCFLQKRKPPNPLGYSMRPNYQKTTGNSVRQRVLSAKLLKLRSIQNQLNDANFHLSELLRENQALKTLQKRQDRALSKYEDTKADLPRLIQSHEEEIRALTERNKNLKKNLKEVNDVLKIREEELSSAREQLKHLEKLNKDKRLTEREKLFEEVEELKNQLEKADSQINILNRKLTAESRSAKHRLNAEISKHKQCQRELLQAMSEIEKLTQLLETKDVSTTRKNRFPGLHNNRQSISLISLGGSGNSRLSSTNSKTYNDETDSKIPVTEVKLEPINCKKEEDSHNLKRTNGILKLPSDNIKARLSSAAKRYDDSNETGYHIKEKNHFADSSDQSNESKDESPRSVDLKKDEDLKDFFKTNSKISIGELEDSYETQYSERLKSENGDSAISVCHKKYSLTDSDISSESRGYSGKSGTLSKTSSSEKLKNIADTIDAAVRKTIENGNNDFDRKLGNYCSNVVKSVQDCSDAIESHEVNLQKSHETTQKLIETFNETKKFESSLKSSMLSLDGHNLDFLQEILQEEINFKRSEKETTENFDKNDRYKVGVEDKKKLLATLRAIDNGDSIESLENTPQRKSHLMKELFSDVSDSKYRTQIYDKYDALYRHNLISAFELNQFPGMVTDSSAAVEIDTGLSEPTVLGIDNAGLSQYTVLPDPGGSSHPQKTHHNWTTNETLALIRSMENHFEELKHPKKRKYVFDNVSNDLISLGFSVCSTNCQTKWKNLVRTYTTAKDAKNKTGRGPSRFQFFFRNGRTIRAPPFQ